MNGDYDVIIDALQRHRDKLWKITKENMNSEFIGMGIMDDIRLEQIDQLDKAILERIMTEHFSKQIEEGATEMFFYGLERKDPFELRIERHRGTLESFPTNLEYVRHLTDGIPLFRETTCGH